MKKIKSIVTGGAGFIGSHLVDKLVGNGHYVTVIDNLSTGRVNNIAHHSKKNVKLVKADISKNKGLEKFFKGNSYVFHLAGLADIVPSIENPEKYFNANVLGTLNILKACKNLKLKKLIYAASASCYGIPKKYPTSENSKIDLQYPYALTKFLGEKMVMHWAKVYKMPNLSLRFFNVYGLRSRTTGAYGAVFGVFLAQKRSNKPLTIVGDGEQTRDFINVKDLVNAIYKASIKKDLKGKIFNIGSGKETSVNEIAKIIGGKKITVPKRPGEPDRSQADITKIKDELGWSPKITVKAGVKELLRNIDNWSGAPVWTPKLIKKATKTWFKLLKKN
jgi:UDP-glucose 4-epimerase